MDISLLKHSLATPISTILINLELALACVQDKQQKTNFQYHLNLAFNSSKYLKQLIDHNNLTQQKFLIKNSILEIINIFQTNDSKQLIKYLDLDDSIEVMGNKLYFQETLSCLINNAFESYHSKLVNQIVVIKAYHNHHDIFISITDGGCGMNWLKQKIAVISKISFKKNHSGIGLAFAKKTIKKKFGGKFTINSKKNYGTTIKIKLPLLKN